MQHDRHFGYNHELGTACVWARLHHRVQWQRSRVQFEGYKLETKRKDAIPYQQIKEKEVTPPTHSPPNDIILSSS